MTEEYSDWARFQLPPVAAAQVNETEAEENRSELELAELEESWAPLLRSIRQPRRRLPLAA